jgi:hypothetical protein
MPRFDGTGPQGQGPMTGRGEGYCAVQLPEPGKPGYGYAGLQGAPVRLEAPPEGPAFGARVSRPSFLAMRQGRSFLSRRGRGARLGRRWQHAQR